MYKVIDENLRSYASVENLNKAVAKFGLEGCHPIIVGVPGTDRVTPLFQLDWIMRANRTILDVVNRGFMVV
jgi:UDP-N-acetyl-D-mannosaminuronate dehydrogenase